MGSRPRAQSPLSVNKTSQWQLAWVFRHTHPALQRGYKRRAHANAHQLFVIGVEPSANLFPDEFAESPDSARPSILFGAPADDRMSIAASEDELVSGNEDSAALPASGREAMPESDPELTAMLSWAAESVGLHWPSPECSRLDDWFLGRRPLTSSCLQFHSKAMGYDQSWTCAFWTGPFTSSHSGC